MCGDKKILDHGRRCKKGNAVISRKKAFRRKEALRTMTNSKASKRESSLVK